MPTWSRVGLKTPTGRRFQQSTTLVGATVQSSPRELLGDMTIRHKELGTTGVMIPEIGVGTWKYKGGPELLRKAVELGATMIDTAESYGNEATVGETIKGLRDQVFVAGKTSHWKYAEVIASVEKSLQKLGVDRIDLYQLHWHNAAVPITETMGAMQTLVDQGKVRFIGVSNFTVPQLKRAQSVMDKYRIVSNQVRYSLVERTVERDVVPYCLEHGMTIIGYSPFDTEFQRILNADRDNVLAEIAMSTDKTVAQVALNWCLSKPGVVTIPKTESQAHLIENCQSSGWELTDRQIAILDDRIRFRSRSRLEVVAKTTVKGFLQRTGLRR